MLIKLYFSKSQPVEYGDLRLSVIEAKSTVRIGQPYDITCRITNTSERSMELQLCLNTKTKLGCGYTGDTEFMVICFKSK